MGGEMSKQVEQSIAEPITAMSKQVEQSIAEPITAISKQVEQSIVEPINAMSKQVEQSIVEPITAMSKQVVQSIAEPITEVCLKVEGEISKQAERFSTVETENKRLRDLKESYGCDYPGSDYRPPDRKTWMAGLGADSIPFNKIVWPGTHDSATDGIGIPLITRPFAECQSLSIYDQLCLGARLLDIRVRQDGRVCHGIVPSYGVDVVLSDLKRFLSETHSEIVVLEIRTEFGQTDPPAFAAYLQDQLGKLLIPHSDTVFEKTVAQLLPGRVVCVWKPRDREARGMDGRLWGGKLLKDNWIDTDLPSTKFESNLKHLAEQPVAWSRKYLYRVENTVTPQADNPVMWVKPVTDRIRCYARLFINQCFLRGCADRLQVFSTDFIDSDFVDACVGLTHSRIIPQAA